MDGPLRCQMTEEETVAHTWNDLVSRPLSERSDVPDDVRSRFEHIQKLMREDPEWIATETRREKPQAATQRSFERVTLWLNEHKRKPMRGTSKEESSIAQTWNTLCRRLHHDYNLPANVADGVREFNKKMKEDPVWIAAATARSSVRRRPRVVASSSSVDVLRQIHCLLVDALKDAAAGTLLCVTDVFGALRGKQSKEKAHSWTLLGRDVGNLEIFHVLLDLARTHEIGTSAQLISHDVVQFPEVESDKIASGVKSVLARMNWVTFPIHEIYEAVAANLCVTPEALSADAVLLNQCLAEIAAKSMQTGTDDFLFSTNVVASASVCKACVTWQGRNEATPVFHPCLRKCNEKISYCGTHVGKINSGVGLSHATLAR